MKDNLANTVYSGVAEIGKARTTLSLVIAVVLCVCSVSLGIYTSTIKDKYTMKTNAVITSSNCTGDTTPEHRRCVNDLDFTINDKKYSGNIQENIQRNKGDSIQIKYNPENPSDIQDMNSISIQKLSWIFIGFGIGALLIASIYYYFVSTYKPLAAIDGVSTIYDVGKYMFKE